MKEGNNMKKHLDMSSLYNSYTSLFRMWYDDHESMIETMKRNRDSDIQNGYDISGNCIMRQNREIEEYKEKFFEQLFKFIYFDSIEQVNNWCFIDMIKRGVIE